VHTELYSRILKVIDHIGVLSVLWGIGVLLKRILKKQVFRLWTGIICLRLGASSGLLWIQS
jgi:hypothetical protein